MVEQLVVRKYDIVAAPGYGQDVNDIVALVPVEVADTFPNLASERTDWQTGAGLGYYEFDQPSKDVLIGLLIKSVQELSARLAALEA